MYGPCEYGETLTLWTCTACIEKLILIENMILLIVAVFK